jgi:glycyl-tRNA synthetase alpha chain
MPKNCSNQTKWNYYHYRKRQCPTRKNFFRWFEDCRNEAKKCIENDLALPAYDYTIMASHVFNVLDARKAISQTERQNYILKIRELAKMVAEKYVEMEGQ